MELIRSTLYNDPSLKAYYRFLPNALTTDSSKATAKTLSAIATPTSASTKKYGGGVTYNGSTQAHSATDHADFKPAGVFSVSGWVNFTSSAGEMCIFQSYHQGFGWKFEVGSGKVFCWFGISGGGNGLAGNAVINDGFLHHLVLTWDGTNRTWIVDGKQDNQDANGAPTYDAGTNYIRTGCGSDNGTNSLWYAGSVYDLAFFNGKVLNTSEINSLLLDKPAIVPLRPAIFKPGLAR